MTTTVTGRNGYQYDAKHISGNLYIVGRFIVIVVDGICQETVCKATKVKVAELLLATKAMRSIGDSSLGSYL